MTTETNETAVITDLPAKKQKRHNPFVKKDDTTTVDTNETSTRKGRKIHGVYAVGVALLATGAVAALASKLGGKDNDDVTDVPSDITDIA